VTEMRKFYIEGRPRPEAGEEPAADSRVVTAGYFKTLGIPLIAGREFAAHDRADSLPVIIVSESFAHKFWPDGGAVGRHIGLNPVQPISLTVIGVVGDVRNFDVVRAPEPTLYLPYAQTVDQRTMLHDLIVRTSGDPYALASAVRAAIWDVDVDLSIARVKSMEDVRATATAAQRFNLELLSLMALIAVVLAAQGVYGVTSYSVAQRTREIGLRMALGAGKSSLISLVLAEGALLTVTGVIVGGIVARWTGRLIESLLFGTSAADPLATAGALSLLTFVAAIACIVPASRAARIDPIAALRTE
jgi:putative ABC transport system permease protein